MIAVDIGNSRIKLGRFTPAAGAGGALPFPSEICEFAVTDRTGQFDARPLAEWCSRAITIAGERSELDLETTWLIASVHRGAAERFEKELQRRMAETGAHWQVRRLSFRDVLIPIRVDAPERVGIDRLLAAVAANRLRQSNRAAVVVDLGTATTVDLVSARGEFCGGAILPGIAMSVRALAEQTDALPLVPYDAQDREPAPVGKSTTAAIESGLYWGAVGAIRELIRQYSEVASPPPDVFLTGGAAARFAQRLAAETKTTSRQPDEPPIVQHVESLVLSGIALVHEAAAQP